MGRRESSSGRKLPIQIERWPNRRQLPIQLLCERQLRTDGFWPELCVDGPGKRYCNFHHEVDEVAWILSGTARITFAGKREELTAGDRVFIPAESVYSLENIGSTKLVWLAAPRLLSSLFSGECLGRRL